MADAGNKTAPTQGAVDAFIEAVADDRRRDDARTVAGLMGEVTGQPAVLWGSSIVGFGSRHYRYASGREGDVPAVSFSPRTAQTALYLTGALSEYEDVLSRLGAHQTGKGCLYLKRVDDADLAVLREIIARSYRAASAD